MGCLLASQSLKHCLTHWGWVMHICVNKLIIIDSDNGLSPGRRQAIIWTNAVILLIETIGTNFSEKAFEKVVCEMVVILFRPQCVKAIGFTATHLHHVGGNLLSLQKLSGKLVQLGNNTTPFELNSIQFPLQSHCLCVCMYLEVVFMAFGNHKFPEN